MANDEQPLIYDKRDDGVAIVSIDDDPLNRMTLAYIDELERVVADIDAAERMGVHATMGSPDAREGMLAFLEKRKAVFNQPAD